MRSGLLAIVMAWLAACEPSTGLQFDIDATGDPTATEVVVYIGKGEGEAASIAAELRAPSDLHKGRFWPIGLDPESFELTASKRTATISFAPGGDSSKVTVVAVGLTNGIPSSVATKVVTKIRTDLVEVWTLMLEPASNDVATNTGRAVQRWGEDPGDHTCVQAVDRSATDPALTNLFIGKGDDRDCDGHRRLLDDDSPNPSECDDDWHDAAATPSATTLSCLETKSLSGGGTDACIFGGRQCTDGRPELRTDCGLAKPFCAPSALCQRCSSGDAQERFKCAVELDPPQHEVPHLQCALEVNVAVTPAVLCTKALTVKQPATLGACGTTPAYHSADPATTWTTTTEFGGIALTFTSASTPDACVALIIAKEIVGGTLDPSAAPQHGLLSQELGIRPGVIAPIQFSVLPVQACMTSVRACTVAQADPTETIMACLQGF